jgi:PKD repeat protein
VTLTVTNECGEDDVVKTDYITITECDDCYDCVNGQCVYRCTICETCEGDVCVNTCNAEAGPDQTIALGGSVAIGGSPTSSCTECSYSWSPGTSLNDPTSPNPTASPTSTTTYTVTVHYSEGCEVFDSVTVTVLTPPGGGGTPGPDKCYMIVDMLGERTLVEIDCCTNTTVEECEAYDENLVHLFELEDETLVQCGECEGCNCYPKIIVMSLSEETIDPPDGMTMVGPLYDFTGYKDIRQELACDLATYFDPTATVLLNYDPELLAPGASEPVIGFFSHTDNQWVLLPPDAGRVAEIGTASGVTGYFASPFAVLASAPPEETPEPPPANPSPAHFVASGLSITPAEVPTGEAVTISLNVANDGEESGTYTVELLINGSGIDSKIVTLGGGEDQAVSFAVSASEAGTYDASAAGLNGSFTVVKSSMWWIYLIIAAVVILLGLMALRFRRTPAKK